MDACCQYVKIRFDRPFDNKFNPFSQVGCVRIACQGYFADQDTVAIANYPEVPIDEQPVMSKSMKLPEVDISKFDPMLRDKLQALESQKKVSVETEDFAEAKRLKLQSDEIKVLGQQIINLETQQKVAVENEDFDTCKVIKFELDKLKQQALGDPARLLTPINHQEDPDVISQFPGADAQSVHFKLEEQSDQGYQDDQMIDERPPPSRRSKYHIDERPIRPSQEYQDEQLEEQEVRNQMEERKYNYVKNRDNITVGGDGDNLVDFNTADDDNREEYLQTMKQELEQLEDVPVAMKALADNFQEITDEDTVKRIFASKWQQRE